MIFLCREFREKSWHNFTVGVIGTGKIGQAVIRDRSGFGCKIYAYDVYQAEKVKKYAEYVDNIHEIYQKCDLITLHMPLFESNFHMIDESALSQMKDGVVLINTARGGLIDTKALIKGLESGKVGAAGLDVIEDEFGLYYKDLKAQCLRKHDLSILRAFPNVVVTGADQRYFPGGFNLSNTFCLYFVQLRIAKVKPSRKVPLISTCHNHIREGPQNGQIVFS